MSETLPKRDTIVLVDFSNLAHTCWHPAVAAQEAGLKALEEHRGKCVVCEIGDPCDAKPRQYDAKKVLLENLNLKFGTLAEAIGTSVKTWVMVKDGRETKRRQLWPAYKGTREPMEFDPRPLAEEHLRAKGCRFCWSPEAEADDTIATMATDLAASGMDVVIVSSDKDMWSLWNPPQIRIYLTTKKEFLTREYLGSKFPERSKTSKVPGIEDVRHVRLCKALWGDPSDNLPNAAPRMQAELTPLIKSGDGTLSGFFIQAECAFLRGQLSKRCHQLLVDCGGQVCTNYEVAGLYLDVPVEWL